jgi:hypothetical protein
MHRISVLIIVLAATSACGIVEPDHKRTEREASYLSYAGSPALLEAPDTVIAGTPFFVRVRTYGGGCIDQGDTETAINEHLIEIRPFDIFTTHLPRGYACTDILAFYTHTVSLRIATSGTWTVRAIGRAGPGDNPETAEGTVVVR